MTYIETFTVEVMMSRITNFTLTCVAMTSFLASKLLAQDDFERSPISYSESTPVNCISALQERIDAGTFELERHKTFGYLPAVLKALNIPVESQVFVFSKTSLQIRYISPRTPRAIYFNDHAYIGYCQHGDVLEVSAVDPKLGAVFYTLDQEPSDKPRFERRTDNCLICHGSSRTEGVPGHLARSLMTDTSGHPIFSAGSRSVDHTTPFDQRWGGWYVTGTHGTQKHLGNLVVRTRTVTEPVDNAAGQNVQELKDRFDVTKYLSPHSDIVALMLLEHQILVHNRLTKANFDTRQAIDYDAMMNRLLDKSANVLSESTERRIKSTGDRLVEAMLFVNETALTEPVRGTSGYTEWFTKSGPFDQNGRSLRDVDMATRLFKYPCSYLIYSEDFDGLPTPSRDYVWKRLWDALSGNDQSPKFAHLSAADRRAIIEIVRDTKPSVPDYWKQ
jgi:hypothetical protein